MAWITHESLAKSLNYTRIDDVVFLPAELDKQELKDIAFLVRHDRELSSFFREDVYDHHPLTILHTLKLKFEAHRHAFDTDPEWADKMPLTFCRSQNIDHAFHTWDFEQYAIIPTYPFAKAPFMVTEDGISVDAINAFKLHRLEQVAQLGYLHDAITDQFGQVSSFSLTYSHTRYEHVLCVMALMTLMMRNNEITGQPFNTGRVAALTHDVLTPARGDTTKMLDYEAFDEDAHYPEVFERFDLAHFLQKHDIDPVLLIQTVQGRGVLGQLLNYADKLAYIATDLRRYTKQPRTAVLDPDPILTLAQRHPDLCTIWDDVRVENDTVFFSDIDRLAAFLNTRAVMFQNFYWHPNTRFLEFVFGSVILKYLWDTGKINREILLKITDPELDMIIAHELDFPDFYLDVNTFGEPQAELFDSYEEAAAREAELTEKGIVFAAIESLPRTIKVGTHIKVKSGDDVLPLSAAEPGLARLLQSKSRLPYPYRLYYITELQASDRFLESFTAYKQSKLKLKSA